MNGIKGILFDFGGTLDTNGTHWGIMLQEAYREVGFSLEDKIFREIYVQGERQLAAQPGYCYQRYVQGSFAKKNLLRT